MRTEGFIIEDDIYVVVEGNHFDLHNDFDFTGYRYSEVDCVLSLNWVLGKGDWVRSGQPTSLRLQFEGVSFFEIQPPNPDLPPDEGACFDGFHFISDEDWCDGPFSGPSSGSLRDLPENCKHHLSFMSEANIILLADACSLHLGEAT
jgi:hypothetical protein